MPNVFITSDHHFGHANICTFLNDDGSKMRPWTDVDAMDADLIAKWNAVVMPQDKVYHLGDVCFHKRVLNRVMPQLNGTKVLIRGNHDNLRLQDYAPHFKDVRGSHQLDNFILTHMPIHQDSIRHWCKGNIHGHMHHGQVMTQRYSGWLRILTPDLRYLNVSVERHSYYPVPFEDLLSLVQNP